MLREDSAGGLWCRKREKSKKREVRGAYACINSIGGGLCLEVEFGISEVSALHSSRAIGNEGQKGRAIKSFGGVSKYYTTIKHPSPTHIGVAAKGFAKLLPQVTKPLSLLPALAGWQELE